jgi:hypothetical protein
MFQHDKIGIVYGLMGLLQDDAGFVKFDGKQHVFHE